VSSETPEPPADDVPSKRPEDTRIRISGRRPSTHPGEPDERRSDEPRDVAAAAAAAARGVAR
jgi:hypothetical protein